jgi:TFIIS helical bundle-like domain
MFLSKSDEETTANRKLAKELVDKWVSVYLLCTIKILRYATCVPS